MLEIQIRNVGKIKEACIELPGITVIAGLNGTGKSTIAKSVFAAVNARKNIAGKIRNDQRQSIEDELEQWLEQNNDFDDIMLFFEAHEELTQHILEAYENEKWEKDEIYEKTKKIIKEYCADNILDTSDIEEPVEEIVRILNRNLDEYVRFFVEQYYQNVFRDQINPIGTEKTAFVNYRKTDEEKTVTSSVSFQHNKMSIIGKILTLQQENAIYIETHSVLDFCQNLGRRSNRTGGMTLPTRELLSSLSAERKLTFAQQQEQERNQKIVQDIAENITHGHLQKSKNGTIEFWDEGINEKIEFSNMSAGLKLFTVLQQLISDYSLKRGDVLIVDEPEVNLHPTWQITLAEILVRIYKELGIFILANSHSPYFIRAIEVKMAEYECALQGRYYFMKQDENAYISTDVTENTNEIYDALYQPLNLL